MPSGVLRRVFCSFKILVLLLPGPPLLLRSHRGRLLATWLALGVVSLSPGRPIEGCLVAWRVSRHGSRGPPWKAGVRHTAPWAPSRQSRALLSFVSPAPVTRPVTFCEGVYDWEVGWGPRKCTRVSLIICSPARPRDSRAHGRRHTPMPGPHRLRGACGARAPCAPLTPA